MTDSSRCRWERIIRIAVDVVYTAGALCVVGLGLTVLFGSREIVDPSAMLPKTWREAAFIGLALGSVPMLLACLGFCAVNHIKHSVRRKRNTAMVFLPGIICAGCAAFIVGLLTIGSAIYELTR